MITTRIGIISGTGIHAIPGLTRQRLCIVETPYGDANVTLGSLAHTAVAWIQRHGPGHYLAPNRVNYHSNLLGLQYLGIREVFATNAVGAISPNLKSGEICVLSDVIGIQRSRTSFYTRTVMHVDFSSPYSQQLNDQLVLAAESIGLNVARVVYAATAGPRFESAAEVEALRRIGADVVGMTSDIEASLARELGLGYAALGIVANAGAGADTPVHTSEVMTAVSRCAPAVAQILAGGVALAQARTRILSSA